MILVLAILAGCAAVQPDPLRCRRRDRRHPRRGAGDHDRLPAGVARRAGRRCTRCWPPRTRRVQADFTLLVDFRRLTGVTDMTWTVGARAGRPAAAPRPPDLPPPTPSPVPSPDPSANPTPTGTPQPTPSGAGAAGPRSMARGSACSRRWRWRSPPIFGDVELDRDLPWSPPGRLEGPLAPDLLFPELGEGGRFRLRREAPVRGSIVAQDGTVFARTRDDGTGSIRRSGWPARPSAMPPRPLPTCTRASAWAFVAATWSACGLEQAPMRCWPAHPASSARFRERRPGGRAAPRDGPRG